MDNATSVNILRQRSSGILLPVFSLPGPFGIGDIGLSARNFIDFLQKSEFMVGIGVTKYFGELKLFIDENGTPRPIRHLLSRKDILQIDSLQQFRITEM